MKQVNWWHSWKNKHCSATNVNKPVVLTPHLEIWFCHWSEYNHCSIRWILIQEFITLAFGDFLTILPMLPQSAKKSTDSGIKNKVKTLSVVEAES